MKYIIYDNIGYLKGLQERIEEEGFAASYNKKDVDTSNAIVISTEVRNGASYIGITDMLSRIISNRMHMYAVLKVMGVTVPKFYTPASGYIDEKYLKKGKTYILESSSFPPYINKETEDALHMLKLYGKTATILREVPYEVSLDVEGWFNGIQLVSPSYITFDSMIMHPLSRTSKLFKQSLGKLEEMLKKADYKGPLSIQVGLTKDKLYGLYIDVSMKPMVFEAMKGVAKNLNVVSSASKNSINMYNMWTMQAPVFLTTAIRGLPVLGYNEKNAKHLWLTNVEKDGSIHRYNGSSCLVGYITARGETPRECIRRIKRTKEQLYIPFSPSLVFPQMILERWKKLEEWEWV